ncbi:T9SS type A sorting domain-containing protein [Flavobacterium album]|nr:T9SS type A sorting domain-containing protein [Flavobacterium album]
MNQIYNFIKGMLSLPRKVREEGAFTSLPERQGGGLFSMTAFVAVAVLLLFGSASSYAQTTYYSKSAATDFNSTASWGTGTDGTGAAPAAISNADNFVIANNSAMALSGNAAVRQLTINAGSLTVSANTLTVSTATTFDSSFTVNTGGTFTISGGSLIVNGNVLFNSGSNFNQSGGIISVDGNNGGSVTGSVATGTQIFAIGSIATGYSAGTVSLTGGKIIIVDPHAAAGTNDYAFNVNASSTAMNITAGTGHTLQIGDGVSTDAGGNATNGFWVYFWYGTGAFKPGNYVINSAAGTNRFVFQQYRSIVGGDLTITKGELVLSSTGPYIFAGNISVDGTLTSISQVILGNGSYTGGTSYSETPATVPQTVSGTGVFRNALTSPTANFATLSINNSTIAGVTISGYNNIASQPANSMSVSGTLEFKTGRVGTTGGASVVLGNSSPAAGTLTYNAGTGFKTGTTFGRWYTATGTGTNFAAGSDATGTASRYPFINSFGVDRSAWIERTTPSGAGVVAITYNETAGVSTIAATDGATAVDVKSNDTWAVSMPAGTPTATSFKIQLQAPTLFGGLLASASARVIQGTTFVGTHQAGTTTPGAQRIGLTQAELTAAPFSIAASSADTPFVSVASGNWNDPATWNKNMVPSCTDVVTITAATSVTSNSAGNVAKNLTINTGGSLIVASGDLTIGCTLNNNTFVNNGTLTVSGGTLNVNGNMTHSSASIFNQSGGNINVDGNAAGVAANSVASGTSIVQLNSNMIFWTGGTLTIVDPHANSTASNVLAYNNASNVNVTAGHTLRFGNGLSTDAGGNATNGFRIAANAGSGRISFNNFVIDALAGTNRYVTTASAFGINGDLTINANSEFRQGSTTYVAGNIYNNGSYVNTSTLYFGKFIDGTAGPAVNAQMLTGLGTFTNAATGSTANVTSLTVNNTSVGGVTISSPISVSGTLTLTAGKVNTSLTSQLTLGTATAAGTLTGGSDTAYINGPFARTIASGNANTNYILFPVGKTTYAPIWLAPATTSVSVMKAEAFDVNAGTPDTGIANLSATRRWEAPLLSGTMTSLNVRMSNAVFTTDNIPVMAPSAAGAYAGSFGSPATYVAGPPATIQSNNAVAAAAYTGFLSFATLSPCTGVPAPGNTIASQNAICLGSSVALSVQNAVAGSGVTYQWQSSPDNITYTDISSATGTTYTATPAQPTYYRLNVTCASGPSTGSSTPVQITFANNITSVTPAARCGEGTVSLAAEANSGATVKWYAAATGGAPVGTGSPFVTPSINATTTYYAAALTATTGTTVIGTASTLTGDTEQPTAFNNRWPSYKQQIIYSASELSAAGLVAGNITSLAFNVATLGSAATNPNFTVKIGTTAGTSFANTTYLTPTFTTVFGPATYTHTATGWQTINFTTPYSWDGTSNIVLEFTMSGADLSNNTQTYYTDTTVNTVNWIYSNNTSTTGTLSSKRPNITFGGQVGCLSGRVPVVATVVTPPTFTLSAATAAICNGQSVTVTATAGAADFDTYVWTPSTGVTGNATTGWTFTPTATTTYTLNASQSTGGMCATSRTVTITVNALPGVISVTPPAGPVCTNTIVPLTAAGASVSATATIGTATTQTGDTEELTSFNNRRVTYKSQTIYTAAELTAGGLQAGNLVSIAYNISSIGTAATNPNYTVKIGTTALTAFPDTSYLSEASFTTVYGPVNQTHAVGLNTITFSTPYLWDGVSNIVISVSMSGADGLYNAQTYYTDLGANTTLYNYNDLTATAGTISTKRFNVLIAQSFSNPVTWSPVTNLYTDAAASVPYVAGSNASVVYVKSATPVATTYTATATNASNCTRTATAEVNTVNCDIDWANVQWPASGTITTCEDFTIYAQVYKAGVTEAAGQGANITAWIGISTTNTDPSTWAESSWHLATFNLQVGNNDEYMYTVSGLPAGTYYYASRFRFLTGSNYYGGYVGGQWDGTTNVSGTLTVNGTAAPTAAATQTFCNAGTVAGLAATGTAIKWYSAATGGTALDGTTALTNGGVYYASQTVGGCESSTRAMVTVTVNTPAAPTAAATQTFCNSGTVAGLAATGTAGATISWYAAATGGTALDGTTALTDGGVYYASQTVNGCESATRTMVTASVGVIAAPVAVASQTVCNSGTVADLVATGVAGATITWYTAATGGTVVPSTTALTNGGVYYASQTVGTCESTTRTMVTATINTVAAPVAAASQTVCNAGTLADLAATGGAGATITWYAAATGGTSLPATTALTNGGVYYASATISGCESTTRTMVTVTVNTVAAPVADASQTVCNSGTLADINATGGAGATITWYAAATGGTALPLTTALTNGGVYYASAMVSGCESATRTMVTATVSVVDAPTVTTVQPTCTTATGTITVTAPVGAGFMYSIDGTNFQASPVFAGVDTGSYTLTAKNASNCTATASVSIDAAPSAPAQATVTTVQPTCSAATGSVTVTAPIGAGYTYSIDGTNFQAGTAFTGLVAGTYNVTVQAAGGCTSVSAPITINAAPAGPDAPTGEATQVITVDAAADATIEDIVVTATGTITWYATEEDALSGSNALATGTQVTDGTTYYGTQTIEECESAPIAVTVDVVLGKEDFNISAFRYHPNPVKDVLNISYSSEISAVMVYDLLGQKVLSKQPNVNEVKLDLSGLADATYIVNVTVGDTVKTIKVVKKQ